MGRCTWCGHCTAEAPCLARRMTPARIPCLNGFSGAGGWEVWDAHLGLSTNGIENDEAAAETAMLNGATNLVYQQDIRTYHLTSNPYVGAKFSPPCTEFTVAGSGDGRRALVDLVRAVPLVRGNAIGVPAGVRQQYPEASLILEPMRLIREAAAAYSPFRWIVMEQVREVMPVWEAYAHVLRTMGYSVATGVLKAEQFAVPQSRRRGVLIASLDREVTLPEPTHTAYTSGYVKVAGMRYRDGGLLPWVSMADALNVDTPAPGAYLRSNYGTGGDASKRGIRRLHQVAPTVTRKYNRNKWMLGAEEVGRVTDAQAAAFQSFPPGYRWSGTPEQVRLQIGNAIPPLLARAILQQVL